MIGCIEMFVPTLVRLLSVGVSVAMIGLACWSPLLAAPQPGAELDGTGGKAPVSQQLHGLAPGPPAKFRRPREVVPSVVEPQAEFPGLAVSQPGSDAPPTRSAFSESTGPVIVGRVLYRGPVPAPIQIEVNRDPDVCGRTMSMTTLSVDARHSWASECHSACGYGRGCGACGRICGDSRRSSKQTMPVPSPCRSRAGGEWDGNN